MSRLIHLLARFYPRSWRQRYGTEFAALLEDVRPDARTAANVLTGALAMHIRNWKSWNILAASALTGAAVIASLFVAIPDSYVSKAVVKVETHGDRIDRLDLFNALAMDVASRGKLTQIITTFDLYRRERSRMPADDVIEEMKKNIFIEPLGTTVSAFRIRFSYGDPRVAQNVTQALAARFIDANLNMQQREPHGVNLQILDPASLPQTPDYPSKPMLIGLGIVCFLLMWGGLSVWRSVSARRYALAGSSISSSGSPGGGATALTLPPSRQHLRRSSWKILAAVALLIAVAVLSFKMATLSYESTAVIRVLPTANSQATPDYLLSLAQSVEDRFPLTRIITTYNLYQAERSRMPFDGVMERMKKHIRIEPLPRGSRNVAGIRIRFSYPDRHLAQKVTQELVSQFIAASSSGDSAATLSVLDPASLPAPRFFLGEPQFTDGLFLGLLLGIILAVIVALFRRSTARVETNA